MTFGRRNRTAPSTEKNRGHQNQENKKSMKESFFDVPVSMRHDLECGEGLGEKHASFILGTGQKQLGNQVTTYIVNEYPAGPTRH